MNIFVCVKPVPDTETKIKLGGEGIDPTGVKFVMNPYDEIAVEEALKLKGARPQSQVWAVSVAPKGRATDVLRTALAMGADEALLVDAASEIDCFQTAKALAEVIKKKGSVAAVFSGKLAIDDNASSVSQMVAEFLGLPHATSVNKATYTDSSATVEREIEGGAREVVQVQLPAVMAAAKGLNTPRYASLPGIMKAKKKTIEETSLEALGVSASDKKVSHSGFQLPADRPSVKMISGEPAQQAQELAKLLRGEAKVL